MSCGSLVVWVYSLFAVTVLPLLVIRRSVPRRCDGGGHARRGREAEDRVASGDSEVVEAFTSTTFCPRHHL